MHRTRLLYAGYNYTTCEIVQSAIPDIRRLWLVFLKFCPLLWPGQRAPKRPARMPATPAANSPPRRRRKPLGVEVPSWQEDEPCEVRGTIPSRVAGLFKRPEPVGGAAS